MLEQSVLLIMPEAERVTICDVTDENVLGFAKLQPYQNLWQRLIARPVWKIHESDDEPLLFTMSQGWGWTPRWKVVDADDRPVGTIRGRELIDRRLSRVASLSWHESSQTGVFLDSREREIALIESCNMSWRLIFSGENLESPFVRMLLLATVIGHMPLLQSATGAVTHASS